MRYLTAVLRPVEKIHPTIPRLTGTADITPVAIHQTRLLDDGTEVTLFQVRGDLDQLRDLLASDSSNLEHSIAGHRDGFVYSRSEPHELARSLLALRDRYEVVVRMPLRFTADGGLLGTVIGDDETFQRAVDSLPDGLDVEVAAIGDYQPDLRDMFSGLTDRQHEILRTAIREGYYEDPRRTSQREIATVLGIAPSTVSQHLRRIEATVFSRYVLDSDRSDTPSATR